MTPQLRHEARCGLELAALARSPLFLRPGRAADPAPTLLIPGFMAGDASLQVLGGWLKRRGHRVSAAAMWANVDCSAQALARLEERAERAVDRAGGRIAIVGQSRGGSMGRALAARRPDLIERLVTLGSPVVDQFAVHPAVGVVARAVAALSAFGVPGLFSADCVEGDCCAQVDRDLAAALDGSVHATAIYSRTDGVVDWRCCLDPSAEHVEVRSSHCGMSANVEVYRVLRDVLDRADQPARGRAETSRRAA